LATSTFPFRLRAAKHLEAMRAFPGQLKIRLLKTGQNRYAGGANS